MPEIVVGVDGSPGGGAALRWALREAVARGDTAVTAVRAWLPGEVTPLSVTVSWAVQEQAAGPAARELAEHAVKLAVDAVPGADQVDVRIETPFGEAAHELVAASGEADLVVVGTTGRGALSRALVGSVCAKALRLVRAPVVVVPADTPETGPQRVLVGVDHSAASLDALVLAAVQARSHHAVLVPVLVHAPVDDRRLRARGSTFDTSTLEANERRALEDLARRAGADGLDIRPEVVVGHPEQALRSLAHATDLVVVGHATGHLGSDLGSVGRKLALHATCPVMVSAP